jgi:prevent-host-death family protein
MTKGARKFDLDRVTRLNLSTVKANLAVVIARVEDGEIIIVTKYGRDAAAIVPMSFLIEH